MNSISFTEAKKACRDLGFTLRRTIPGDSERVPVIFRLEQNGDEWTPVAFFPTLPGTNNPFTCTTYAHIGQHCSAEKGYYRTTKRADSESVAPLRRELESIGYVLDVRERWTQDLDKMRFAELNRSRGAV